MNIVKTLEDSKLTLKLEGRLDTSTAPELDAVLNESLDGITELVFDMEALAYISSAGLRVLLAAQKKMKKQGKMELCNVVPDVMEVFEITGFSDVLTII